MRRFATLVLCAGCAACAGDPPADPQLAAPEGRVLLELRQPAGAPPACTVTACFWNGPAEELDGGCAGSQVGNCCLGPTDPGIALRSCVEQNLDVGPVTLLDNGVPIGALGFDAGVYVATGPPPSWRPGDKLEVTGGGAFGFPLFAVTLTVPKPPTLTQPAVAAGALGVDRGQPLVFGWSPPGASDSDLWITTTDAAAAAFSADCEALGDPGSQTLSAAILQQLPAGLGAAEVALENRSSEGPVLAIGRSETDLVVQTQ